MKPLSLSLFLFFRDERSKSVKQSRDEVWWAWSRNHSNHSKTKGRGRRRKSKEDRDDKAPESFRSEANSVLIKRDSDEAAGWHDDRPDGFKLIAKIECDRANRRLEPSNSLGGQTAISISIRLCTKRAAQDAERWATFRWKCAVSSSWMNAKNRSMRKPWSGVVKPISDWIRLLRWQVSQSS